MVVNIGFDLFCISGVLACVYIASLIYDADNLDWSTFALMLASIAMVTCFLLVASLLIASVAVWIV